MSTDHSASQFLRAATRDGHEGVDSAFSRFGIDKPSGYARFLQAHARVLPQAERLLAPASLLERWQGRAGALAADLAALNVPSPPALEFALPEGKGARWGAIYVVEGSRLGGAVLSRMVPPGLPTAYLGATHPSGAWRDLLGRIDAADTGPAWRTDAAAGANAMFEAYRMAADAEFQ